MGFSLFRRPGQVVLKDPCGANCGKVFIKSDDPGGNPTWELYDPAADTFTQYAYTSTKQMEEMTSASGCSGTFPYSPACEWLTLPQPVRLSDGRILVIGRTGGRNLAKLFSPSDLGSGYVFPDASPPQYILPWAAPLPNGGVLYTGVPLVYKPYSDANGYSDAYGPWDSVGNLVRASAIYRSQPTGPGQWHSAGSSCVSASEVSGNFDNCAIMASLPDGRVLARSTFGTAPDSTGAGGSGKNYLFDPAAERWTRSSDYDFATPETASTAVFLDPHVGSCGSQCGQVLVSGAEPYSIVDVYGAYRAYLFSPPSS
jgi:hypothetical protein